MRLGGARRTRQELQSARCVEKLIAQILEESDR